jgi:hypothetical protein
VEKFDAKARMSVAVDEIEKVKIGIGEPLNINIPQANQPKDFE